MASQNNYYQLTAEETLKSLASRKDGLSNDEVAQRLKLYGKNKLTEVGKKSIFLTLLYQLKDLMAIIMLVAGTFSLFIRSYRDAIIMFGIVFVNLLIGFFQEYKAERIMDSLKGMTRAKAKVIRNGKAMEVDSELIVPGDIVVIDEGDAPPADIRVIEENTLSTNDFSLTGESNPTRKFRHSIAGQVGLGDRNNLVFMGTTVATGNATGIVISTGMQTELGRIANLSQTTVEELSPLQKELNNLAKKVTYTALLVGIILFGVGMLMHFTLRESFLFAMGIAASCVPEGLPAQVSVALSLAAGRLALKKAVIKKLSAVETLGSTHIICTDKTGTLTTNEMTVQKIMIGERIMDVDNIGYEPTGKITDTSGKVLTKSELDKLKIFFENGVFASNAKICAPDAEHPKWYAIGDPTEAALITLAGKAGADNKALDTKYPELKEFTFDAARKRMSSVRKIDNEHRLYVKGAPISVLERCSHIWDGSKVREITQADKEAILKKTDEFAMMALRNLAYAYRVIPKFDAKMTMEQSEQSLIWLGLVSMIDPPRKEVKSAIESALKAYVRVIIITGDYALTAEAIAKKIGMTSGKDKKLTVVTGKELSTMSDIDLLHKLIFTNLIFARTSPEDKLRIVDLLKRAGEVVAVTGDGVNDAPALKKADIGVAMGRTGTDVAKESSELILLDDSFGTLVTAIQEGRTIFQNLKKTILSTITSNMAELTAVLLSLIFTSLYGTPLAILAVQILAIDLVGEMVPLTFLTWDPAGKNLMTTPPRNPSSHIITGKTLFNICWAGFVMGALGFINFMLLFSRENVSAVGMASDNPMYLRATTLTYVTIILGQWMNILSRRAEGESVFTSYMWSNKRLIIGYLISLFFILNISYNPYISQFLGTGPLTLIDWGLAVTAAIIFLLIREFYKLTVRVRMKKII
jgi:P-type Ca2+ transporter type 2C